MSFNINVNNQGYGGFENFSNQNVVNRNNQPADKDLKSLENLLIGNGKGGSHLNPEMKGMLEKVAQFMDKHPEMFGKPHGKDSWLSELKEDNFLNGKESKQFGDAIDMMKDAMGGASGAGGSQGG